MISTYENYFIDKSICKNYFIDKWTTSNLLVSQGKVEKIHVKGRMPSMEKCD